MNIEVFKSPHQFFKINLSVSIIVKNSEYTANTADCHGTTFFKSFLNFYNHRFSSVLGSCLFNLLVRAIWCSNNVPRVLLADCLISILTYFLATIFARKHLGLIVGGNTSATDFKFLTEIISVNNIITG